MVWLLFIPLSTIYYYLCKKVKFFSFDGRTSRADYWIVYIFVYPLFFIPYIYCLFFIIELIGWQNESIAFPILILGIVFYRALRFPVDVRRCHDINYSGWHSILFLIPILGSLILLANFTKKGNDDKNKYGENPLLEKKLLLEEEDVPERFKN
tara:strand:- start:141 stop:599 length:459 start_codon:yes stop_codon:yes gene_type:complete